MRNLWRTTIHSHKCWLPCLTRVISDPIWFLTDLNDITDSRVHTRATLYAHHTVLRKKAGKNFDDLITSLDSMGKNFVDNRQTLNSEKNTIQKMEG